jgi:hypothetical protein
MLLIALVGLTACGSSKSKPQDNLQKNKNLNDNIEFAYSIQITNLRANKKTEENFIVNGDTLKFHICKGDGAGDYKYRLNVADDSLKVLESCDPRTMEKCMRDFCVYCRITGLKKGYYNLSFWGSHKRIEIK